MAGNGLETSRVNDELAKRGWEGLAGHLLGLSAILSSTTLLHDRLDLALCITSLFCLQVAARTVLLLFRRVRRWKDSANWRRVLICNIFSLGLTWGLITSFMMARYGFYHRNSLLSMVYFCAVTTTGIHPLVFNLRAIRTYVALLYSPILLTILFTMHVSDWGALVTCAFYAVFLASQGGRMHKEYLARQEDRCELADQAYRDYLTKLPNRRRLEQILEEELSVAKTRAASLALLYIDLDGFKGINDLYTHRAGDLFLCEVARRLSSLVTAPSTPARLSGDEFVVLLTGSPSHAQATHFAAAVLEELGRPFTLEGNGVRAGASIGISFFPFDCQSSSELFRSADLAMYSAKRMGKNRFHFANPPEHVCSPDTASESLRNLDIAVR